ncbi:hypothetical protein ABFV58_26395, partial [Pseudomonas protegens]
PPRRGRGGRFWGVRPRAPRHLVCPHPHPPTGPTTSGRGPPPAATGPIRSVYLRDPDLNLIEISEQL